MLFTNYHLLHFSALAIKQHKIGRQSAVDEYLNLQLANALR